MLVGGTRRGRAAAPRGRASCDRRGGPRGARARRRVPRSARSRAGGWWTRSPRSAGHGPVTAIGAAAGGAVIAALVVAGAVLAGDRAHAPGLPHDRVAAAPPGVGAASPTPRTRARRCPDGRRVRTHPVRLSGNGRSSGRLESRDRARASTLRAVGIHDPAHLRHRGCRLLPRQGSDGEQPRPTPSLPWPPRHDAEARPVPQRGPGHHEPVPARRGLRHRGRRRDRPGRRPLRAVPRRQPRRLGQRDHRPGLLAGHRQGASRRVPRRHRAGHPAHHRRDQDPHAVSRRTTTST